MPYVKLKEGEGLDQALRRFKRSCEKAGIYSELRRREFYEKPTTIRRRSRTAAIKRREKKEMKFKEMIKNRMRNHRGER